MLPEIIILFLFALLLTFLAERRHSQHMEREGELLRMIRSLENRLSAKDISGHLALEESQKEKREPEREPMRHPELEPYDPSGMLGQL